MNQLVIATVRKSCVFVLQIENPVNTLRKVVMFFEDRYIVIEQLQFHKLENGNADLMILCRVEKDRIDRTVQLLKKMQGVESMEILK